MEAERRKQKRDGVGDDHVVRPDPAPGRRDIRETDACEPDEEKGPACGVDLRVAAVAHDPRERRHDPDHQQHDDDDPGRAAERPRDAGFVGRTVDEAPAFGADEIDRAAGCFDRSRPRGSAVAAAVVQDQAEVAEAVLSVVGQPRAEQDDADAHARDDCAPVDIARAIREQRTDRKDERDRRQVERDRDDEEHRDKQRNPGAISLEHDEQGPQQRNRHDRQIVLLEQQAAEVHRPWRGREQRDRDQRHRDAEARTDKDVRERDRDDRQDGDRHGREDEAAVNRDEGGDDVDVEGRVGCAGARGQTDRAYVAVNDVVRDA